MTIINHRLAMVEDYRAERARQLERADEVGLGYPTEVAEYLELHPAVTFKQWLIWFRRTAA